MKGLTGKRTTMVYTTEGFISEKEWNRRQKEIKEWVEGGNDAPLPKHFGPSNVGGEGWDDHPEEW